MDGRRTPQATIAARTWAPAAAPVHGITRGGGTHKREQVVPHMPLPSLHRLLRPRATATPVDNLGDMLGGLSIDGSVADEMQSPLLKHTLEELRRLLGEGKAPPPQQLSEWGEWVANVREALDKPYAAGLSPVAILVIALLAINEVKDAQPKRHEAAQEILRVWFAPHFVAHDFDAAKGPSPRS